MQALERANTVRLGRVESRGRLHPGSPAGRMNLSRVTRTRMRMQTARDAYDSAVLSARRRGHVLEDIARAAGVSEAAIRGQLARIERRAA
jgi:hypothetical protein